MNKHIVFALATLAIALALYAYWLGGADVDSGTSEQTNRRQEQSKTSQHSQLQTSDQVSDVAAVTSSPAIASLAPPPSQEKILEEIEAASITYDPVYLPKIRPFLTHPDPEVREAALNGIVNLGDEAGAPLLREAARQLNNAQEASKLMEMADYLELPPATTVIPRSSATSSTPKP